MPGYLIHLATGVVYKSNNIITNTNDFIKGIIAPDQSSDKAISHYGPYTSRPNLNTFIKEIGGIKNSFQEGYFLHLVTDYLFYNRFLEKFSPAIYNDYDILNKYLQLKYNISIPNEIKPEVKFTNGTLSILDKKKLDKFIDTVGHLDLRKIVLKDTPDYKNEIDTSFLYK